MDAWLLETGHDRGYVASAQTMYELSKDWYSGRMDEDWRPRTAAEAETTFHEHGLTGKFWSLT